MQNGIRRWKGFRFPPRFCEAPVTLLKQRHALVTLLALFLMSVINTSATTLRVVSYNIEADVDGVTTPRSGLYTVLEAIGEQNMNGVLQPLDILALQETTSNSTTVAPIVAALNGYYGDGTYALVAYQVHPARERIRREWPERLTLQYDDPAARPPKRRTGGGCAGHAE